MVGRDSLSWWQDKEAAGHIAFGREAGRDERWCPARFLLFLWSGTPVQGMGPPTFMVDLLTLINLT